jgi:hypothetical protein
MCSTAGQGVLATSGAVAIIVGLALQSTLSDVFSGIVLNTTKPYQIDDWISIDGTEGRVTTSIGAPRACKPPGQHGGDSQLPGGQGQDHQLQRPADMFGLAVSLQVSPHVRPKR